MEQWLMMVVHIVLILNRFAGTILRIQRVKDCMIRIAS